MLPFRAGLVWLIAIVVLMGVFFLFAYGIGWPAIVDSCDKTGCYCEHYDIDLVKAGARGIRQPVNTWFNLYAIFTSGLMMVLIGIDRWKGNGGNAMRSSWWVADAYVFAALFLGLGSMWLHASISAAVSWMDGLSMYIYAGFLVFYTLDRGLAKHGVSDAWRTNLMRWGYPGTAVLFTLIGQIGVPSLYLIIILVAAYAVLEFAYAGFIQDWPAVVFWMAGAAAMENAVLFWVLSKTRTSPLCNEYSSFQPHGLLWHPLAGVMALMMFFYWRRDRGPFTVPGGGASSTVASNADSGSGWS